MRKLKLCARVAHDLPQGGAGGPKDVGGGGHLGTLDICVLYILFYFFFFS